MKNLSRTLIATGVLSVAAASPAFAQQQPTTPDPEELLRLMQAGQMPGNPLQTQEGTWLYPVASGLHEGLLGDREIGGGNGIDADFLARSSLQAVYTAAGDPPTCDGSSQADMRGRSRIVAMEVWTGSGPYLGENQMSRLVVNQELNHVVIYLHGDVREWVPGENFCDDRQYVLAGSGRGMLRLDYETNTHIVPLNFTAYPHPSTVDMQSVENACAMLRDNMYEAYQDVNRRWGFIGNQFEGPIDWSVITPVPEGYTNGEQASFADGLFNTRDVVEAASGASDAISMGRELGQVFAQAPSLARGAGGAVGWAVVQVANHYIEGALPDPAEMMMDIAQAGDAAYRSSGEPSARQVSDHAMQRVNHPDGDLRGLNVDYIVHTVMQACEDMEDMDLQSGTAYGHFSWPGGMVALNGRGFAPGAPAAIASGPVQSTSIRDALAMAQAYGGATAPSAEEIEASLPEGFSLDSLPIPMAGQAGGGGQIAPGAPEWFVSYNVQIVDEGERIATLWFDPRR